LPAVDKELAGQDLSGKAAAVGQIRDGAYGQLTGLLQMAAAGDVAPDQRRKILDVLVRDAGHFGTGFTQAQRRELAGMIDQAAAASPEVKAQADGLKKAIAAAPCGTLCSA
jgi:hypothetical protein